MVPSPRKRTPFHQTWHEADAAHLDPSALPVARIPRGWERKREVRQASDGKEKSIWRRFTLRSTTAHTADQDDTEEDGHGHEHDAQSRAVKRRQRLSPKAMEKMRGNKRAFKGTRWDRSKSVLARKTSAHASEPADKQTPDITHGLTLRCTPAKLAPREHTPRRLHSPPPPLRIDSGPDDATMTVALDDDTAILKSFLSRAAASKAERSAIITRRESLENRRDSDMVRHALASPRNALQDKDPNSPSKLDSQSLVDLAATPVLGAELDGSASPTPEQPEPEDGKTGRGSRRSSRAKKSRLPAPATTTHPQASNKIAIRRAHGTDPVVLKKTDAQELALITKSNTRKNKQGAFMVSLRLLKLQAEAILSPSTPLDHETPRDPAPGRRGIRWDETLAYYQEHADTLAAQQAEADSLATPDELSIPAATSTNKAKAKTPTDKNSTPKIRRVRGLGTVNGTPAKALLSSGSLLPDAMQEEQAAAPPTPALAPAPAAKGIPKPKVSRKLPVAATLADSKLATPEVTPVRVELVKERKSRLATPKSVRLPKPMATAERENTRTGLSGATPRKGIPAPKIVAPKPIAPPTTTGSVGVGVGVESGLPRRRGRKV